MPVSITDVEFKAIEDYCFKNQVQAAVEFGTGVSTQALCNVLYAVFSYESSWFWYAVWQWKLRHRKNLCIKKYKYESVDLSVFPKRKVVKGVHGWTMRIIGVQLAFVDGPPLKHCDRSRIIKVLLQTDIPHILVHDADKMDYDFIEILPNTNIGVLRSSNGTEAV